MSPELLHTIQGIATNVMLLVLIFMFFRKMASRNDITVVDDTEPLFEDEPGERYIRYCKAIAAHQKTGFKLTNAENERIAKLFGVDPGNMGMGL